MNVSRVALVLGAGYGFLAVLLGAFGAHALKDKLVPEMLAVWKTAVEYHLAHAIALLLVGLLAAQRPALPLQGVVICFALGLLCFSGSLYALAFSGLRALGAITPVGGLLLLTGWALLLRAALKA